MAMASLLLSSLLWTNSCGAVIIATTNRASIIPRSKPQAITYGTGLQLSHIPATDSYSVRDSCSSLKAVFTAPDDNRGSNVTSFFVEWWDSAGTPEIESIRLYSATAFYGTFRLSYNGYLTDYIHYNASESVIQTELEALPDIRNIHVSKIFASNSSYFGSEWRITFTSTYPSVYNERVSIDYSGIASSTAGAVIGEVGVIQSASLPHGYQNTVLPYRPGVKTYQYVLSGLLTGVPYAVQVSSRSASGVSAVQTSVPAMVAPPRQKPSPPTDVYLVTSSARSLKLLWRSPESDGGDSVTSYRIEWDLSSSFNSSAGHAVGSHHMQVEMGDCGLTHCAYVIAGLVKGTPYFARVFALNSFGYSVQPGLPLSLSEVPKTQPQCPAAVKVAPLTSDSLQVNVTAPLDDGGAAVSQYRVEWDVVGPEAFDTVLTQPASSLLFFPYDVQKIQTSASTYNIAGHFAINFAGFLSASIPVAASAELMKTLLEAVPTVGEVHVSREEDPLHHGVSWLVTFVNSEWWRGDSFYDLPLMTVSGDNGSSSSASVSAGSGSTFSGTQASISVTSVVKAMSGFEQQMIDTKASGGSLLGQFTLSFRAQSTAPIPVSASEADIAVSLAALAGVGKVIVRRRNYSSSGEGFQLVLIFVEQLGNIETVRLDSSRLLSSDGGASVSVYYTDLVIGTVPAMESAYRGEKIVAVTHPTTDVSFTIDGLLPGAAYHVRVYAWNGVGNVYGEGAGSSPAVVMPTDAPLQAGDIALIPTSPSSLRVSWTTPSVSGVGVSAYRVEVALAPIATEMQLITINSSVAGFTGSFCLSYHNFASPVLPYDASASRVEAALESLPGIGNVVVTQSLISGSSYGISWAVQFLDNVGNVDSLSVSCNNLVGEGVQIFVLERNAGADADFAVPISIPVVKSKSVQTITVKSTSTDLNGYFHVTCSGETSLPIDVYSSASDVKSILESMLTIDAVEVSVIDHSLESTSPVRNYGRSWFVTFLSAHFQSLLVSTDGGSTADVVAYGGNLMGSRPVVSVERSSIESLSNSIEVMDLSFGSRYIARVSAYNGYFWSTASVGLMSSAPKLAIPQPPINVFMRPVSNTQLAVWWDVPLQNGGSPISGYEVKWDRTPLFGVNANFQFVANKSNFIIPNLQGNSTYSIGVSAYNSVGYSAVVLASLRFEEYPAFTDATVTLDKTRPSAPEQVTLTIVSVSELGVLWNSPLYDGGLPILSYLVEWDTSPYFVRAGQMSYSALVLASSISSNLAWQYSYQIAALPAVPIYVRVSALNGPQGPINSSSIAVPAWPINSTSCTSMPFHCSATPTAQLPYLPVNPYTQLGVAEVANRLEVTWQQPVLDSFGFSTVSYGNHTPDIASFYRIEWSEYASFENSSHYNARMLSGFNAIQDCSISCSVTIGVEIQNVSIASTNGEDLTSGSFALIYPGIHNYQYMVQVRIDDSLVSVLSPGVTLNIMDFLKIGDMLYQIVNITTLAKVVINPPFAGGYSDIVSASHIRYPSTILNFDASPSDVIAHLESQLIPGGNSGPYANFSNLFDVTVERLTYGHSWLVTFKGEMFYDNVDELTVLTLMNSTYDVTNLQSFGTLHVPSFARTSVSVSSIAKANYIKPGVSIFVRVMAINSIGIGPSLQCATSSDGTKFGSIAPRSAPGLPILPLVYAVPNSNGSLLRVVWAEGETYGGRTTAYAIEWIMLPALSWSGFNSITVSPSAQGSSESFERIIPVIANHSYSVRVRQFNDQGPSPPSWFLNITDGSSFTNYISSAEDYHAGAQVCLPTCPDGLDECLEANSREILARGLPGDPVLIVPNIAQIFAQPSFSRESVVVFFNVLHPNGDYIDKYRVEWDEESSFDSPMKQSAETSATEYNITDLAMGQTYFIRVFAHNSIGYGSSSETYSFVPVQQPDPPSKPSLKLAENADSLSIYARSLNVSWSYPSIFGPDEVGDGGDGVVSYLVEWSRLPFSSLIPTIQQIDIAYSVASSKFSLSLQTTTEVNTVASASSAYINVNASSHEVLTILQNMPNIAAIEVTKTTDGHSTKYLIKFNEAIEVPLIVPGISDVGVSVNVAITQNSSFTGSFYASARVAAKAGEYAHSYLISNLLPGHVYYTRVSAGNALGYGARRITGPSSLQVPVTQPTLPTQIDGNWGVPRVYLTSSSSVLLQIGHPSFDGGALASTYVIEWDTASTFDSNPNLSKSPIGQLSIPSYTVLCRSCVTSVDFPSISNNNATVIQYSGSSLSVQLLKTGSRVAIITSDDHVPYTFTISGYPATLNSFVVDGPGFRVLPFIANYSVLPDLLLLGAELEISDLSPGSKYFFRVGSENTPGICPPLIKSCGSFVSTEPASLELSDAPDAPVNVGATVLSTQSIQINWNRPASIGTILSYRVDAFTKSAAATSSFSFFGDTEIQLISTSHANISGGTFTLALDSFSINSTITVTGLINSHYFYTSSDVTPYISPLDMVKVGARLYTVASQMERNVSGFHVVERIRQNVGDVSVNNELLYLRPKTVPIAYNVEALHMRSILQSTPGFGQVWVDRKVMGLGFDWMITFLTFPGDAPQIVSNSDKLLGNKTTIVSDVIRDGSFPDNFLSRNVEAEGDQLSTTFIALTMGQQWYFRVVARSAYGDSSYSAIVSTTPAGSPKSPSSLTIAALSGSSLLATLSLDADSQGSAIDRYVMTLQSNSAFMATTGSRRLSSSNGSVVISPSYQVQKVTTSAHTLPFSPGSTFTLSIQSYRGTYSINIATNPLFLSKFIAVDGATKITRSAADSSSNHIHVEVTPGEYIQVAGQEFRVCLNQDAAFVAAYGSLDINTIPLCRIDDAITPKTIDTGFESNILYDIPVFQMDTFVGQVNSPLLGSSSILIAYSNLVLNPSANDLSPGDWIKIGHPDDGEAFRVSAISNSLITLATASEDMSSAALSYTALQHSTYEVQSIMFSTSGALINSSSAYFASGFRLRFKGAVTYSTQIGGSFGCLNVGADESVLQAELLTLLPVDKIQVSRVKADSSVTFLITFSGSLIRGSNPLIEVEDLGSNGCISSAVTSIVSLNRKSVVPVYRLQTTAPLPFDCTADELKDALEALTLVNRVDVSRSVNGNGFDWMVSFRSAFASSANYPLLVNHANLAAAVSGTAKVSSVAEYIFEGLTTGVAYAVSAAAGNAFGLGPSILSVPTSVAPVDQVPNSPINLRVRAVDWYKISAQFQSASSTGDRHTAYSMIQFTPLILGAKGIPLGEVDILSIDIASASEVQVVSVVSAFNHIIGGTFSLSFLGMSTTQLDYNITASGLKSALETLPLIESVQVSRELFCSEEKGINDCGDLRGYTWMITFVDVVDNGNQFESYCSRFESNYNSRLQIDSSYLKSCPSSDPTACNVNTAAQGFIHSFQEVQQLCLCHADDSDITLFGQTVKVSSPPSSAKVKSAIQSILGAGGVTVTRTSSNVHCNCAVGAGDLYKVEFSSYEGDVPQMQTSSGLSTELFKGTSQYTSGVDEYAVTLTSSMFTSGIPLYFRVAAVSNVGTSAFAALVKPIRPSIATPLPVLNPSIKVVSENSLLLLWDDVVQNFTSGYYDIQLDTNKAFASSCLSLTCIPQNIQSLQSFIQPFSASSPVHSYFIENLTPGRKYYIRIRKCLALSVVTRCALHLNLLVALLLTPMDSLLSPYLLTLWRKSDSLKKLRSVG